MSKTVSKEFRRSPGYRSPDFRPTRKQKFWVCHFLFLSKDPSGWWHSAREAFRPTSEPGYMRHKFEFLWLRLEIWVRQ